MTTPRMTCTVFRQNVGDAVDGRLPGLLVDAFEEHRSSCAGCAEELVSLSGVRKRLLGLGLPAAPADLWPRVAPALGEQPRQMPAGPGWSSHVRRLGWMRSAALVLCTATVAAILWSEGRPTREDAAPAGEKARAPENVALADGESRMKKPSLDRLEEAKSGAEMTEVEQSLAATRSKAAAADEDAGVAVGAADAPVPTVSPQGEVPGKDMAMAGTALHFRTDDPGYRLFDRATRDLATDIQVRFAFVGGTVSPPPVVFDQEVVFSILPGLQGLSDDSVRTIDASVSSSAWDFDLADRVQPSPPEPARQAPSEAGPGSGAPGRGSKPPPAAAPGAPAPAELASGLAVGGGVSAEAAEESEKRKETGLLTRVRREIESTRPAVVTTVFVVGGDSAPVSLGATLDQVGAGGGAGQVAVPLDKKAAEAALGGGMRGSWPVQWADLPEARAQEFVSRIESMPGVRIRAVGETRSRPADGAAPQGDAAPHERRLIFLFEPR